LYQIKKEAIKNGSDKVFFGIREGGGKWRKEGYK